jgi:ABC-2 type transport system permease protein
MRRLIACLRTTALIARVDVQVAFRRALSRFSRTSTALCVSGGALLAFHFLAWPAVGLLIDLQRRSGRESLYPVFLGGVFFVMPWLISQSINGVSRAFYAGSELELILSAPISPRAAFAARCLAIAVEGAISVGIFLGPFADVLALRAGPRWLALYPALVASSLFATALGALIAFFLFRLMGPRWTRLFAQVTAAILGACFILFLQIVAFLNKGGSVGAVLPAQRAKSAIAMAWSPFWLPVQAALGEPERLAAWCLISIVALFGVIVCCGPAFFRFAAMTPGAESGSNVSSGGSSPFVGGEGRALRLKEWRLLRRDPWLISQILLQIIYTLPIGIVIWRSPALHGSVAFATAPTIVVIACQITGSLAWLAMSTEEAPELLLSAPVSQRRIELRKLQAIVPSVACIIGPPLIALAWIEPGAAILTFCFALCAGASSALLNFWHPMPGRRKEMLRRHAQSKLVGLMEHLLSLIWATAVCLAFLKSPATLALIGASIFLLYLNRPRRSAKSYPRHPLSRPQGFVIGQSFRRAFSSARPNRR